MYFVQISFIVITCLFIIIGGLFIFCQHYLPDLLKQGILYGKTAEKTKNKFLYKLQLPKRYFQHFYIFAAPLYIYVLFLSVARYFFDKQTPEFVLSILDICVGNYRKPIVPLVNTLFALALLTIHILKRVYETQKISVFSDAKMNIIHYIMAYLHYFAAVAAAIGESEGFVKNSDVNFQNWLKIKDWIGAIMFLWMTYQQLESNVILSNLRKDKKGVVVTKEYKIPKGGLFDYISAPLQFTEIGVYGALQIILWESTAFSFIVFWVASNQFICAFASHQWYIKNFKNYPTSRKIIIPFLL